MYYPVGGLMRILNQLKRETTAKCSFFQIVYPFLYRFFQDFTAARQKNLRKATSAGLRCGIIHVLACQSLSSSFSAFTMFLKRNKKVSKPLRETYLNFCEALFRILKRRPGRWESLETFIRETTMLTDRAWLLETLARERALNP